MEVQGFREMSEVKFLRKVKGCTKTEFLMKK